ncbi:MAG: GNAT family N-acetyltransferase [Candidatus Thiodiazotropha sp.]
MFLNKLNKGWKRLRNGEYRYLGKRIFPGGNIVFYMGRQLIFRLSDMEAFNAQRMKTRSLCKDHTIISERIDIEALCNEYPHKAEVFSERVNRGDRCYVAKSNGVISAYVWLQESKHYFDTNSLLGFNPGKMDGVWFFDLFVKPEYRRRGLFSLIVSTVYEDYSRKGYKTLYSETYHTNEVSIVSHNRLGCHVICEVKYISVLGLKTYIIDHKEKGRSIQFRYALNVKKHKL